MSLKADLRSSLPLAWPARGASVLRPRRSPGQIAPQEKSFEAPAAESIGHADLAMERYATGDDSAFEIVYATLAPRILAFARRFVRDEATAQDAVQQTFLHIHRARGTFRRGGRVLPWALAVTRMVLRQDWRQRPRLEVVARDPSALVDAVPGVGAADLARSIEARQLVMLAASHLQTLSVGRRMAYELVKLEGLSHAEAAQVMGTTTMTIKLRVHRVMTGLRDLAAREGTA
jgi:RNA polymerase sigma-70 factor (ECF subfamily)